MNDEILELVADVYAEDYLMLGYRQHAALGERAARNREETP